MKKYQVKHISDEMVKEACKRYRPLGHPDQKATKFVTDHLMEISNCPEKVCYAKLEQCANRGLINYGVSLRTCWWEGEEKK